MADLNVTKSQAIDQCNELIEKIYEANSDTSTRTEQLEKALAGVATLLSSAHEALESIQGTLGSVEEDSIYQCALAMVQKAGVVADAVDGYSSRGEASAWFEPWVEEKTS